VAILVAVVVAAALSAAALALHWARSGETSWVVPSGYTASPDERTLTLHVWGGACDDLTTADVTAQDADSVAVEVARHQRRGSCPAIAILKTIDVTLDEPLDGRRVEDRAGCAVPPVKPGAVPAMGCGRP
jgi:uncharacterized protein YpuA (DUF1002 family)